MRRNEPTVLALEDIHWADEATLDVLRLVSRRIDGVRALVVVSFRDEAVDAHHPVRVMLGELASGLGATRLPLAPLSAAAVAELADAYDIAETRGTVGTVCIYQASSPEAIRKHAAAAGLPVDEIVSVADTVIVRPDPVPATV